MLDLCKIKWILIACKCFLFLAEKNVLKMIQNYIIPINIIVLL